MGFSDLVEYLWIFFLIAGLPIMITWLLIMNRAIDQVSHDLRRIEPGAVWLSLIPLFGLVWQFIVVGAVGDGIAKEMLARNMLPREEKPAYAVGLTGCILMCCCIIPYAGVCLAIIGLLFMVVHTIKIAEYNSVLKQSGRWEARYHERMAAIRQQMNEQYTGYTNPYNAYPPPPVMNPHNAQQYPPPPQYKPPGYTPPPMYSPPPPTQDERTFTKGKDKPENPFG